MFKLFKNKCYNGGAKHKFEARYSEEPNLMLKGAQIKYSTTQDAKTILTVKKYIHDICIWCGKVIKDK